MPEEKQDQPRSAGSFWEIIRDLSAIGGITFFFLIVLEWSYVSGFYETLGVSGLSRRVLETAPGKYGIGTYIFDILMRIFPALIAGIAFGKALTYVSIKLSEELKKTDKAWICCLIDLYSKLYIPLQIGGLLLIGSIMLQYCSWDNPTVMQIGMLSALSYLGVYSASHYSHWARWSMYVIVSLFAVLLMWSVSIFIFRDGQKVAFQLLTGESSLPGVGIITNAPLAVSPAVDVDRGYNWRYYPREVPNTDSLVFSLQYVGEDENAVYILDYVARRVIVVPREEIHSMVLFPTMAYQQDVPVIVDPRVSTPVQRATFSPLPPPSPSPSPGQ